MEWRNWLIGLLTAALVGVLLWHFNVTSDILADLARIDERGLSRTRGLEQVRAAQRDLLGELGGLGEQLERLEGSLAAYAVKVETVRDRQVQMDARMDAAHLMYSKALSDVATNRQQIGALHEVVHGLRGGG